MAVPFHVAASGVHLSDDLRITFADALLIASALVALITLVVMIRRNVVRPAQAAFVRSVGDAARQSIREEVGPIRRQVADLHGKLADHLEREADEITTIREALVTMGAEDGDRTDRISKLERTTAQLVQRVDEFGNQMATDSAKVIAAVREPDDGHA